jgi:hypothetical protein
VANDDPFAVVINNVNATSILDVKFKEESAISEEDAVVPEEEVSRP